MQDTKASLLDKIEELGMDQIGKHEFADSVEQFQNKWKRRIETALEQECHLLLEALPDTFQKGFHNLYIAGGAIYSLYNEQAVKDYDFFSRDYNYLMLLRGFFGQHVEYSSKNVQRGEWEGYKIVLTPNAISIDDWQIITNWWGTPEEVVGQFDFKHTMNWYDGVLHCPDGEDYLDSNVLWYNQDRARDFVGTILRIPAFIEKGFHICKSEHCKILQKLKESGFNDKDTQTMTNYLDY